MSFSVPSSISVSYPLSVSNGGTNSNSALSGSSIMVSNSSSIIQGPAGSETTVLHGNASGLPTYSSVDLTADVSGVLNTSNGGSGQSTYSDGQLLIGNTAGGLTKATLTAGENINITNGDGSITIASTGGGSGIPYDKKVLYVSANGNSTTTFTAIGFPGTFTASSSSSGRAITTTSIKDSARRVAFQTGSSGVTTYFGQVLSPLMYFRGNVAGVGGFKAVCRWCIPTNNISQRMFVGFSTNSAILPASSSETSTLTNALGFGVDTTDTNLQFLHNDGSGTCTKIDLGSSFTARTTNAVYETTISCLPNDSVVDWSIKNLVTNEINSGTASTNLPVNTTLLAFQACTSNSGAAVNVSIEFISLYIETNF